MWLVLSIWTHTMIGIALEYPFDELYIREGGGGLESHPTLTTGTLYKSVDNVTTMKRAREVLLSLAPTRFNISLSLCYNYTNNYRRGSLQAVTHHVGRGVNEDLSLKKPRIWVPQRVINLHWTVCNVNLAHYLSWCQICKIHYLGRFISYTATRTLLESEASFTWSYMGPITE